MDKNVLNKEQLNRTCECIKKALSRIRNSKLSRQYLNNSDKKTGIMINVLKEAGYSEEEINETLQPIADKMIDTYIQIRESSVTWAFLFTRNIQLLL